MGLFDFISQNAKTLSELDIQKDGSVSIPYDDFDFSSPDLEFQAKDNELVFQVAVYDFVLVCRIRANDVPKATSYLSAISSPKIRKDLVVALEGEFRDRAEAMVEMAEDALINAQADFKDQKSEYNSFLEALRQVKSSWKVL